jgi:hypothetical protein
MMRPVTGVIMRLVFFVSIVLMFENYALYYPKRSLFQNHMPIGVQVSRVSIKDHRRLKDYATIMSTSFPKSGFALKP